MTLLKTEQRADYEQPQPAKPRYTADTGFWSSPLPSGGFLHVATEDTIPDEQRHSGSQAY